MHSVVYQLFYELNKTILVIPHKYAFKIKLLYMYLFSYLSTFVIINVSLPYQLKLTLNIKLEDRTFLIHCF